MIEVKDKAAFDKAVKSNKAVVADFWAPWCGPCKMVLPLVERISKDYTDVTFLKVDVEENRELAAEYKVASVPSLLFFKNGQLQKTEVGVKSQAVIEENVNALL